MEDNIKKGKRGRKVGSTKKAMEERRKSESDADNIDLDNHSSDDVESDENSIENLIDIKLLEEDDSKISIISGDNSEDEDFDNLLINTNPDEVPDKDYDPLQAPVIKRDYTSGNEKGDANFNQQGNVNNNLDIPEPDFNNNNNQFNNSTDDFSGEKNETKPNQEEQTSKTKKEPINPNLEDLSPAQKRKAADKTADALLLTYEQILPLPFIKLSSFNTRKLQIMDMKGEIDLSMQILEDGTTVKGYTDAVNGQVKETFVVTPDMKQEVKEPLVEVLLEQGFALTPTQRLIMAVGGHITQMALATVQFATQNAQALKEFKRFRKEDLESKSNNNNSNNNNNSSTTSNTNNNNGSENFEEDYIVNSGGRGFDDNIAADNPDLDIPETKDDILTVENGGITVTEEA